MFTTNFHETDVIIGLGLCWKTNILVDEMHPLQKHIKNPSDLIKTLLRNYVYYLLLSVTVLHIEIILVSSFLTAELANLSVTFHPYKLQ